MRVKKRTIYVYCHNCKRVLGEPEFLYDEIKKEVEEKHQGHTFTQSGDEENINENKQVLEQGGQERS